VKVVVSFTSQLLYSQRWNPRLTLNRSPDISYSWSGCLEKRKVSHPYWELNLNSLIIQFIALWLHQLHGHQSDRYNVIYKGTLITVEVQFDVWTVLHFVADHVCVTIQVWCYNFVTLHTVVTFIQVFLKVFIRFFKNFLRTVVTTVCHQVALDSAKTWLLLCGRNTMILGRVSWNCTCAVQLWCSLHCVAWRFHIRSKVA